MKNVIRKSGISAMVLLAAFTLATSNTAVANVETPARDKKAGSEIELKFIGHLENQPTFQLNLANTEDDEYTIVIKDEQSNILYTERVRGANIVKKFRLNTEELGNEELRFEVRGRKTNRSEQFKISRNSSVVEETVVTKVQ